MKIYVFTLILCFGIINAQSLYYQRQKEHREGRAHPKEQQGNQQQPWQNVQRQGGQQQYDNQRQTNYKYYNGYRNLDGQGMSIIGPGMYDPTTVQRALLTIQLTTYTNEKRWLPRGLQCYDNSPVAPLPGSGTPKTPLLIESDRDCQFTFTTLISVPDQPMTVIQTQEFLKLTAGNGGNVDLTRTVAWDQLRHIPLAQKPTAINVIVLHSGNERYRNGTVWPWNSGIRYNVLVDSFYQNTTDDIPSMSGGTGNVIALEGQELQTKLGFKYTIACQQSPSGQYYQGINCDLLCNNTVSDSDVVVCYSDVTGIYSVCKASGNQVSVCAQCTNGMDGDQCRTNNGITILQTGVTSGWRAVAIIFIIITAILAIVLFGLIFFWWCTRTKEQKRTAWSEWPYARGRQEESQPSPTRAAPALPVKTSINTGSRDTGSYKQQDPQQNPEWFQPNVVSVNGQRAAPLVQDTPSHHSSQMGDERGSESSYGARTGRITPRREAAV